MNKGMLTIGIILLSIIALLLIIPFGTKALSKTYVDKAKDMREQFLQEAIAYNEANKKNLLSVNELVKQNVDGIMNDLHAMDDEFKAKIKAENDKRFGRDNVQKSWCYFDKNGNLYFRKSAFSK